MPATTVQQNAVCDMTQHIKAQFELHPHKSFRSLTATTAFLSWLRLATYMSIVAVAILISFHLKAEASALEKRIALPFGLVFWILSIACLAAGLNNYVKTVSRYSRRQALVQSGTGTQLVSSLTVVVMNSSFLLAHGS